MAQVCRAEIFFLSAGVRTHRNKLFSVAGMDTNH